MNGIYRLANNEGARSVQSCAGTNWARCFRFRSRDEGRTV